MMTISPIPSNKMAKVDLFDLEQNQQLVNVTNLQINSAKMATINDEGSINQHDKNDQRSNIISNSLRWTILILTLLENLIFSGIVFGWPALIYILKAEHIYEDLCKLTLLNDHDNSTSPKVSLDCIEQENVLNHAYTIGIFMMGFTSFAWGFALESCGLKLVRIFLNLLITLGCGLLLATNDQMDYLIQPAIILLGLIGVPLRIANMTIADYFPNHRSTIISIYSGAFSASPLVFVLCKYFYDHYGPSVSYIGVMSVLFVLSLMMIPTTFIFLPQPSSNGIKTFNWIQLFRHRTKNDDDDDDKDKQKKEEGEEDKDDEVTFRFIDDETMIDNVDIQHSNMETAVDHNDVEDIDKAYQSPPTYRTKVSSSSIIVPKDKSSYGCLCRLFSNASLNDEIPLSISIYSFSFMVHMLWFSWLNTYMVLYSGSLVLWLSRVTDNEHMISTIIQSFGLIQSTALFIAPMAGYIMDNRIMVAKNTKSNEPIRQRLASAQSAFRSMIITNLALSGGTIARFYDHPIGVYVSIIFITLLRSFLIAVASAYIRVRFPQSHFSRLNGVMCTVGAFFSLLNSPLFYYERLNSTYANYVMII
ncbi:hypothetical protein RDWZM_010054 [Blomia tropicalis]|uniref:Solute carrier family 43 member 3-like n=1 Tax=Blomia tropicalis TaxID=40697 RepID=A0A9Q0LYC0_BLOTA|nr:hypothetical protein RDWZM_010054 [Blomia tropicalis]